MCAEIEKKETFVATPRRVVDNEEYTILINGDIDMTIYWCVILCGKDNAAPDISYQLHIFYTYNFTLLSLNSDC